MCGRFDNLIARDAYRGLFRVGRLANSNFPLRYNVAPTDQIPRYDFVMGGGRKGHERHGVEVKDGEHYLHCLKQ